VGAPRPGGGVAIAATPKDDTPRTGRGEQRDPHPEDTRLRRHGFRIWRRPKKGPVTWLHDRREYTQAEALTVAQAWEMFGPEPDLAAA
jgi:hypothetical protein